MTTIQPKTYVRAPGAVKAVRLPSTENLRGDTDYHTAYSHASEWCGSEVYVGVGRNYREYLYLNVPTPGGSIITSNGDWILKDATGAFHTMKHRQFTEMYMELPDPSPEEEEKSPWTQPTLF